MSLFFWRFQGPLFMIVATASYVTNDTLMKLATVGLPPYQVLLLRGVFATLWAVPLLLAVGFARQMPLLLRPSVLLRNSMELIAILSFIIALANMPLANAAALGQITPAPRSARRLLLPGREAGLAKGRSRQPGLCRRADGGTAQRRGHFNLCIAGAVECCVRSRP
jgi:hypothetical protein